jgi:hypothetical protein
MYGYAARHYDVLNAQGKPAGKVLLDSPGTIVAATERAVWILEIDQDDVPTVVRYPVLRATR